MDAGLGGLAGVAGFDHRDEALDELRVELRARAAAQFGHRLGLRHAFVIRTVDGHRRICVDERHADLGVTAHDGVFVWREPARFAQYPSGTAILPTSCSNGVTTGLPRICPCIRETSGS